MRDLELGLIGNCAFAALVDRRAEMVWACLPRFDSDPVFCSLLEPAGERRGRFCVELQGMLGSQHHYERNTAASDLSGHRHPRSDRHHHCHLSLSNPFLQELR